jgi:acyl-CoA synthetase (AMP-forming)/AMP-acid ligase II
MKLTIVLKSCCSSIAHRRVISAKMMLLDRQLFAKDNLTDIALIDPNDESHKLTYGETFKLVSDAGDYLMKLFPAGAVVSMMFPNSVDFAVTFLSVTDAQCVAAPLNPKYTSQEAEYFMLDSKPVAIFIPTGAALKSVAELSERLQIPVFQCGIDWKTKRLKITSVSTKPSLNVSGNHSRRKLQADNVALVLYTSGTTSRPKCVPLSHGNIVQTMRNIKATYRLHSSDRTLLVMPLFHVHGLIGCLLSTLLSGGSAVIMPSSVSVFWRVFDKYECTWYSAVPTIHQMLLASEDKNSSSGKRGRLRFIRSCSSSLAPTVFDQLQKTYHVPVVEAYAMTEAAHQMTSNPLPPAARKAGSVGKPQGVEVMIVDKHGKPTTLGEVCCRGPNVTKGYLRRPEANKESFLPDGWFRTGDQGYMDSDGYLFLTGRLKELINRGGEKISPLEIDAVLLHHPQVAEAVSFAAPNALYGEEVQAAVVLRDPSSTVTTEELKQFCSDKLSSFKMPQKIYITKQLPKTATGKVQRRIVASYFLEPKSKL